MFTNVIKNCKVAKFVFILYGSSMLSFMKVVAEFTYRISSCGPTIGLLFLYVVVIQIEIIQAYGFILLYLHICVFNSAWTEPIVDLASSPGGELCCSISLDKTLKVFDVVNFGKVLAHCKYQLGIILLHMFLFLPYMGIWGCEFFKSVLIFPGNMSPLHDIFLKYRFPFRKSVIIHTF